jgi:hypothetical protein
VKKDGEYAAEIPSWRADADLTAVQAANLANLLTHQKKKKPMKKPAVQETPARTEVAAVKPVPTPSKPKKNVETPAQVDPSQKEKSKKRKFKLSLRWKKNPNRVAGRRRTWRKRRELRGLAAANGRGVMDIYRFCIQDSLRNVFIKC